MRGIYQIRLEALKLEAPASILGVLHRGVWNVEGDLCNEKGKCKDSQSASKAILE